MERDTQSAAERIYLSDVELHHQSPISDAADLRGRILFHVLLCDTLLIGDSQALNTPLFRGLVSADEAGRDPGDARPDLGVLLSGGLIRLAMRDGRSLREVREEQQQRGVVHGAGDDYTDLMDRLTGAHTVTYHLGAVADSFRSGVARRLAERGAGTTGEERRTFEAAREFVDAHDPLYFAGLRVWEESLRRRFPGNTEVMLALDAVDRAAAESYLLALPRALGAANAAPRDGTAPAVTDNRILLERTALPSCLLDGFLLGRLPVEVVLEAVHQPSRAALVRQLGLLRRGDPADPSELADAVGEFSGWLTDAFERTFRTGDSRARAVLNGRRNLMRFGIMEDPSTGALSAGLDLVGPPDGHHLDLLVAQHSTVADPARPTAGELRGRAITGAPGS